VTDAVCAPGGVLSLDMMDELPVVRADDTIVLRESPSRSLRVTLLHRVGTMVCQRSVSELTPWQAGNGNIMRRVLYEAADDRQTVADLARTIANDADPRERPSSRSAAQASGSPRPAGCNSTTFLPRATTRPTCGPTCARSAAMRWSARGRRTRTCNSPCEDQTGGATCFQATSGPRR
jgi:hypothetical protein